MSDSEDFADDAMLELFREEAETQLGQLSEGLVAIESTADPAPVLEQLMRAAHSMKGAARIMGIDPIVKLTHVAEDIFVAAQRGELVLAPAAVDVLLEMTDFIKAFSEGGAALDEQGALVSELLVRLDAVRLGELGAGKAKPALEPQPPAAATDERPLVQGLPSDEPVAEAAPAPAAPPEPVKPAPAEGRSIRITAEALERFAGLAGEAMVESSRVESMTDDLSSLRITQRELQKTLNSIRAIVASGKDVLKLAALAPIAVQQLEACKRSVAEHEERLDLFSRRFVSLSNRLSREVVAGRMLPFASILRGYPRLVRDLSRDLGKRCRLILRGEATMIDREVLDRLDSALNHIVRNALDHGIEAPEQRASAGKAEEAQLLIEAYHQAGRLRVVVSDDGGGVDVEKVRRGIIARGLEQEARVLELSQEEVFEFLFLPGFSTAPKVTEISGRGVGLDSVRSMVQEAGGSIVLSSERGRGTRFDLELPLTRSVVRVLSLSIGGHIYAVQVAQIEYAAEVLRSEVSTIEGRAYFERDGNRVALIPATEILELEECEQDQPWLAVVVFREGERHYGLLVDKLLDEQKLLVRPLDRRLGDVPDVAAVSTNEEGDIVLILDADELRRSMDTLISSGRMRSRRITDQESIRSVKRLLVVDDSLTVREAERQMLEYAGYEVDVAVDGLEAWSAVRLSAYDLVITDVDMPRMTGIELVRRIRSEGPRQDVPIIIVSYKDREEDRMRGLEVGANHYVTKGGFSDTELIEAVHDLIGEAGR